MSGAQAHSLDELIRPAIAVADAVLNEGRVLYPYRASAVKNQVRWQWGVLVPRAAAEATGIGDWTACTQCILEGEGAAVSLRVRWLEVLAAEPFDRSELRWVDIARLGPSGPVEVGRPPATTVRAGLSRLPGQRSLARLTVEISNELSWAEPGASWQEVTRRSLAGVHVIAVAHGGRFLSATDPPAFAQGDVRACRNQGLWPSILDGGSLVLAAPIILPDEPAVAPESPGDLCDATEIDELLTLRVLTLTDDEKAEARSTDPLAKEIIDRCESLPPEHLARLHGAIRALRPAPAPGGPWWDPSADPAVDPAQQAVQVGEVVVRRGSRVRLRPSARGDAQDMFLAGRLATVEAVFIDVDGASHVAVVLDDDPGADLARAEGRFLYFGPDELEVAEG